MSSNSEQFIIDLGFSDKEAIEGIKSFLKRVDILSTQVNKKLEKVRVQKFPKDRNPQRQKEVAVRHQEKPTVKRLSDEAKVRKAQEKTAAKRLAAEIKAQEKITAKRLADESRASKAMERSDTRIRNFETKNRSFGVVSRNDPEEALKALRKIRSISNQIAQEEIKPKVDSKRLDYLKRDFNSVEAAIQKTSSAMRIQQREVMKLSTVQRGLSDSSRNLVRSLASVYAAYEGTTAINKTGQDFEALNSAMLAAMGSKKEAANQIQFLDQLTDRLGMSLIDTADQYTKFTFAAKGKLPTKEVNFLFQSMAEMGTVLGVSKERMKLSFTAIQQMMNKTTVTSEELKRQFAESMPGK